MPTRRPSPALRLLAAALLLLPAAARAQAIVQEVLVRYSPSGGAIVGSSDQTAGNAPSDLHDILAELQGPRYRGFASAGVFGDVGTAVGLLAAPAPTTFHRISAQADVRGDPVFVNALGYPVHVFTDFIVDGGELHVIGDPGSYATYALELHTGDPAPRFSTRGRLAVGPAGQRAFTVTGTDIGAAFDGVATVDIPLSLQSADLGVVAPGQALSLFYGLSVEVGTGAGELVTARFSDPFALSGHGVLGTLRFVPVVPTSVPEPATVALVGGALALLAAARRATGRRAAAAP